MFSLFSFTTSHCFVVPPQHHRKYLFWQLDQLAYVLANWSVGVAVGMEENVQLPTLFVLETVAELGFVALHMSSQCVSGGKKTVKGKTNTHWSVHVESGSTYVGFLLLIYFQSLSSPKYSASSLHQVVTFDPKINARWRWYFQNSCNYNKFTWKTLQ